MADKVNQCRQPTDAEAAVQSAREYLESLGGQGDRPAALYDLEALQTVNDQGRLNESARCAAGFSRALSPKAQADLGQLTQDIKTSNQNADRWLSRDEAEDYFKKHEDLAARYGGNFNVFWKMSRARVDVLPHYASKRELAYEDGERLSSVLQGLQSQGVPVAEADLYGFSVAAGDDPERWTPTQLAGVHLLLNKARGDQLSVDSDYFPAALHPDSKDLIPGIIRFLEKHKGEDFEGIALTPHVVDSLVSGLKSGSLTPSENIFVSRLIPGIRKAPDFTVSEPTPYSVRDSTMDSLPIMATALMLGRSAATTVAGGTLGYLYGEKLTETALDGISRWVGTNALLAGSDLNNLAKMVVGLRFAVWMAPHMALAMTKLGTGLYAAELGITAGLTKAVGSNAALLAGELALPLALGGACLYAQYHTMLEIGEDRTTMGQRWRREHGLFFAGQTDPVNVQWDDGKTYAAHVMAVDEKGQRCRVHYDGHRSDQDEWVAFGQVTPRN